MSDSSAHANQVDAVIAEYLRRRDAGEDIDERTFLDAHPAVAEELNAYFVGEAFLSSMTGRSHLQKVTRPAHAHDAERPSTNDAAVGNSPSSGLPSQFGRYQLLKQLGEGAMGTVFLALDTSLGRNVALKVPRTGLSDNVDFMKRFHREARAAGSLNHPNICRVFDVGEVDGTPYITMEYIDGKPLSQLIDSSRMQSVEYVLQLLRTVAEAVSHAHTHGVIHRDLKPGNIMLNAKGVPCVMDFGLARMVEQPGESRLTMEGHILGTPAYMAPEQVAGRQSEIGPRSDIYSFGVILFELLTGRLPFDGNTAEILARVLRDRPPVPSRLRPELNEDADELCLRMMEKAPRLRYPSMQAVMEEIDACLRRLHGSHSERATDREASLLNRHKQQVGELVAKGQFPAAIQELERIITQKDSLSVRVVRWARRTLPEVKAEARALDPAGLEALMDTAQELFRRHDYGGCAQLLQEIPVSRRPENAEELLNTAIQLQTEADELLTDIRNCVNSRQMLGIDDNVQRLLKLKPGSRFAKRLWDALKTYRHIPQQQRIYRFERGKLQPLPRRRFWQTRLFWLMVTVLIILGILNQFGAALIRLMQSSQQQPASVEVSRPIDSGD